jgi:hypothetical protein
MAISSDLCEGIPPVGEDGRVDGWVDVDEPWVNVCDCVWCSSMRMLGSVRAWVIFQRAALG